MAHVLPVPSSVQPAQSDPWFRATLRLLEAESVQVLDIRKLPAAEGVSASARVAVSASQPDPECAAYHVVISRSTAGALTAQCSCASSRARQPQVCKHVVAALICCGFGSLLGVPAGVAPLVLAPFAVVQGERRGS